MLENRNSKFETRYSILRNMRDWLRHGGVAILAILLLFAAPLLSVAQSQKPAGGKVPEGVKLNAQMPAGGAPRAYPFPKPVTRTLPNGLRVFVISDAEQPVVTARLVLPAAGSVHDPAGKPGVASATSDLLTQGTHKRSAQQIAEAIDFVGGSLAASADSDGTYITVTVVRKDLSLGLELLADVTRNAAFPDDEIERRREQSLSGLRIQYSDASYLASAIFDRIVFGNHAYGLPDEGTPDSLRALKREDLVKFRDTYYVPAGAMLAFAGDITPAAAFAAAEKYFGAWAGQQPPAAGAPVPAQRRGVRIVLVDKPDAVQTQIRVGRLGIPRSSGDYIPLAVTNRIFGGGFNSRLSTEVRIRKGLTYGANSGFDSRRLGGSFVASTSTRTEATVEATRLIVNLLEQMATGSASKEELDFARDYMAGVFPIQTEIAEQIASRILTVVHYGLPADYNDTYQQRILGVDETAVRLMAAKYFSPDSLELVLVGNAGAFRDALKKEFPGAQFEELPFDQLDLLAADLRRPKEAAAAATPEALARGQELLQAGAQAAGGAAISRVESIRLTLKWKLFTPQGELDADSKIAAVFPDRLRSDVTLPFGTLTQGFDGKSSWTVTPQGPSDLPPSQNAELTRGIALIAAIGVYREAAAGQAQVALLGEEEVEGRRFIAAEWAGPAGPVKLYFDPQTRLISGVRFRANAPQGSFESLALWSDFRAFEGVQIPFKAVVWRDGAKFIEQSVVEVTLNPKLDPAIFAKP
jgi:zinc protease